MLFIGVFLFVSCEQKHDRDKLTINALMEDIKQEFAPDKRVAIFNIEYKFTQGLPKIHEHNNKPPQALGIFHEGRLVVLYTLESDIGDGWENQEIHNDPETVRLKALRMGANIISYVFKN